MGFCFVFQQLIDALVREDIRNIILVLGHSRAEDINCPYSKDDGRTALHIAAALGNVVYVQLLLWVSTAPFWYWKSVVKSIFGPSFFNMPLIFLIFFNIWFLFIKLCRHMNIYTWCLLILQYNANVKVVDHEGRNALWYARSSGSNECVELLMNNGCPEHPTLPRRRGSSAQAGKNDVFEKLPASVIWALPCWLCAWR